MRTEHDLMGEVQVPDGAFYGASTQRAVDNFPISNLRFDRRFIWALGLIKGSAARVSGRVGYLDPAIAEAIAKAREMVEFARGDVAPDRVDGLLPLVGKVPIGGANEDLELATRRLF